MIVISGTRRSGTSMWMAALHAAGLPVIGERWPRTWGDTPLRQANPEGFYESTLREGINFTTNPDPETGLYLHPAETAHHAVKVFLPALARTDLSFLHRTVITVRAWRDYARSVARLQALDRPAELPVPVEPRPAFVHVLEWWAENFIGLRDVVQRRYACHVVTYEAALANPEGVLGETLTWMGLPEVDVAAAVATINPRLRTAAGEESAVEGVPGDLAATFDELHGRIHQGIPFDVGFLEHLNAVHARLVPLIHEHHRQASLQRRHEGQRAAAPS